MSNKKRRDRARNGSKHAGPRNSARITTGEGAKAYDEETLRMLAGLVPGIEIVHPLGVAEETDEHRLSRARALAGYNLKAYGAVVRLESMATKYWRELVLGSAHELHVMRSHIRHVGAASHCPYGTVIVVFKPGHKDRIENGLCPIYWEA